MIGYVVFIFCQGKEFIGHRIMKDLVNNMHELESKLFQLAQRLAEENKELSEELLILATISHSYQEPNRFV